MQAVVLAVAVLSAIAVIYRLAKAGYRSTLGRKKAAEDRLHCLAPAVRIEYFEAQLGAPAMRRTFGEGIEWVFVDDLFFVQACTDEDGTVLHYSVTTRDPRFRPAVPFPNAGCYWGPDGPQVAARLLETPFAGVESQPDTINFTLGAQRFWYVETHYLANPGNYQSVALSVQDSGATPVGGTGHAPLPEELGVAGTFEPESADLPSVRAWRVAAVPNTYTITASNISLREADPSVGLLGADHDAVRVFASAIGEPRRRRWLAAVLNELR